MATKEEVLHFLKEFSFKLGFWGLLFRSDRTNDKNIRTLLALELNYSHVVKFLKELTYKDYSQGPIEDKLYKNSDMWIFGRIVKKREIYIKIQLGPPDTKTICISFHFSEHPMLYPFKGTADNL